MSTPSTECVRTNEHLLEYAYGELAGAPLEALERHLPGCERCQQDLAGLKATRRVMATLEPVAAPDAGLESLLAYAQKQAARQAAPSRPGWLRWLLVTVPTAAVVLLGISVGLHASDKGAPLSPVSSGVEARNVASAEAVPAAESAQPEEKAQDKLVAAKEAEPAAAVDAKFRSAEQPVAAAPPPPPWKKVAGNEREVAVTEKQQVHVQAPAAAHAQAQHIEASPAPAADRFAKSDLPATRRPAAAVAAPADGALDKLAGKDAADDRVAASAGPSGFVGAGKKDSSGGVAAMPVAQPAPVAAAPKAARPTAKEERVAVLESNVGGAASADLDLEDASRPSRGDRAEAPGGAGRAQGAVSGGHGAEAKKAAPAALAQAGSPAQSTSGNLSPARALEAAQALAKSGDHAGASAAYRAIYQQLRSGPRAEEALFSAALEAQAANRLAEAAQTFEQVAHEFPASVRAPTALARAAEIRRSRDGEGAATTLEQDLLRRYPDSSEARGVLSRSGSASMPAKAKRSAAPSRAMNFSDESAAPAAPAAAPEPATTPAR